MSFHDLGKKIKDGIGRNDLGMPAVILRSFLYSFCLNIIYLIFESACAWVGFIPFSRRFQGGECVQYFGLYWSITQFYPMSSSDHPQASPEPDRTFSFLMFLIAVASIAFVIFVILCIKNGHAKKLLVIIGTVAVIVCGVFLVKNAVKKWKDTPMEFYHMQIITSDLHPGVYHTIDFRVGNPGSALMLVPAGSGGSTYGYSEKIRIENTRTVDEISRKELMALLEAASAVRDHRNGNYKGDFAFKVEITYETRDGYGSVHFWGYDEFPEEWAEFARLANELCGGDYLRENPELVAYSDEWFSETYGIYDSDLPEGASIQDMKDNTWFGMGMDRICGNGISGMTDAFNGEEEVKRYLEYLRRK